MQEMKKTQIEDDLKILKVEFLSNHWSDLPQILNFSSGDQTKIKKPLKRRQLQMEEHFKILKVEYLSNHWSDLPQILNLSLGDQTKITYAWKEADHQWKKISNIKRWIPQ